MTPTDDANMREADDYDRLPYPSMPYPVTQPSRLAAVASLYGIDAAPVEAARVLELGCASGGNIIPLALRFPAARFLGIDIGARHIEEAQARARELGLTNIEFQRRDIASATFAPTSQDYIICHGVFSWVPTAVQDAILRICRDALSPAGIAAISYNVLPGWRLRSAVRDICLRHIDPNAAPRRRVAQVRELLDDIAATTKDSTAYGLLLQQEAQRVAHRPASYILGEFLVDTNEAFHVEDFLARTRRYGLDYLCEADLEAAVPETLRPDLQNKLRLYAGDDTDARERYVDLFTGRTFRTSMLIPARTARMAPRDYGHLRALQFSADVRRHDPKGAVATFTDGKGRAIRAGSTPVANALETLANAHPQTQSFAQLLGDASGEDEHRLIAALSVLVAVGQVEIATTPLTTGRADNQRPTASPLARIEASTGQPWLTGLHHQPVGATAVTRILLPHLNGAATRDELGEVLRRALVSDALRAPAEDLRSFPEPSQLAAHYLDAALTYLAANALLLPPAAGD